MVGRNVGGLLEPETGDLGENRALVGYRSQNPVERADSVGRDYDPAAVRQIIVLPHLAAVIIRQFRKKGFIKNTQRKVPLLASLVQGAILPSPRVLITD